MPVFQRCFPCLRLPRVSGLGLGVMLLCTPLLVAVAPPSVAEAAAPAPATIYVRKTNPSDTGALRRAPIRVHKDALFSVSRARAAVGAPSTVLETATRVGGKGFRAAGLQPVRLGKTDAFVVTGRTAKGRACLMVIDARGRLLAERVHVSASEVPKGVRLGRRVRLSGAMVWRTERGAATTFVVSSAASHMVALEQAAGMERPEGNEYAPMLRVGFDAGDGVSMERPEEDERGGDDVGMERPEDDARGGDGVGMERPEEDERGGNGVGMERPEEDEFPVGVWTFTATDPVLALDAAVNNGTAVLSPELAPPTMAFPVEKLDRVFR